MCLALTGATFAMAWLTNWSWIPQFFALTALGYFVNSTASLRAWKFEPNPALKDSHPELLQTWPEQDNENLIIRIAVQLAGNCHLRGLVALDEARVLQAKSNAMKMKGRYKSTREKSKDSNAPYTETGSNTMQWLSYASQSSYYGLAVSAVPDNVARRSIATIIAIFDGIVLLILGFGATTRKGWSGIVLGVYVAGIIGALLGRRRGAKWTLPEFQVVDLTAMQVPPTVRDRIWMLKGAENIKVDGLSTEFASTVRILLPTAVKTNKIFQGTP